MSNNIQLTKINVKKDNTLTNYHHHVPVKEDNGNSNGNGITVIEVNPSDGSNRDQWGGQMEFLLACLGNAVGLGNVWRFPYLCYKNGGGAFVIPYIAMVFILGLPIFLIELGLGQFSSMGPAHLYANLAPIFKGVGLASIIGSIIVGIYYNMIIAWTLFYFVESFIGQNWQHCGHEYNSLNCTTIDQINKTDHSVSSTEEFFNNYVLGISGGIEQFETIRWKLLLSLFFAWVIVVGALIKGIKTSGKVVYFTATFPYVILIGITLDGAMTGIKYYITPDWTKIKDITVWRDAAVQVFYSFGIGGGGMLTYASYNRFKDPVVKHSVWIGFGDMLTSLFAGFVIFAMIGFMSHTLNKPIPEVVSSGTGLAFIVIPDGLSQMPLSLIWSMMFFAMLFLLGIDSQFAIVETVITYVFDSVRKTNPLVKLNKPLIVTITGIVWFILGLPLCTNSGIYILHLMDTFAAGFPYLLIGFLETIVVVYIYGWNPSILLRSHVVVMLSTIAPIVIAVILFNDIITLLVDEDAVTYGKYVYPPWAAIGLGWGLALIPVLAIPYGAIQYLISNHKSKSFWEHFKSGFKPTERFRQNAKLHIAMDKGSSTIAFVSEALDNNGITSPHKNNMGITNDAFEPTEFNMSNVNSKHVWH